MRRWEYKVVSLRDQQYTAALNEFGRDGWELVSVLSETVDTIFQGERRIDPMSAERRDGASPC